MDFKTWSAGERLDADDLNNKFDEIVKFGGDGSDGAKTVSADEDIDAAGARVVVKNYSSLTIDATKTLGLINPHASGTLLIIKVNGNCVINGKIDLSGDGSGGGAGGLGKTGGTGNGAAGSGGTEPSSWDADNIQAGGGGGGGSTASGYGGGGGGGGAQETVGSVGGGGAVAGTAGIALTNFIYWTDQNRKAIHISVGAGGGGGGGGYYNNSNGDNGKDGGDGGGALLMEVNGNLTFGASSEIDVSGVDGGNATTGDGNHGGGGASGGGSGGQIYVLYNGTLTDGGVTETITAGLGGTTVGGAFDGYAGGDGGDGDSIIEENEVFS